jgi:hypothetical protein
MNFVGPEVERRGHADDRFVAYIAASDGLCGKDLGILATRTTDAKAKLRHVANYLYLRKHKAGVANVRP